MARNIPDLVISAAVMQPVTGPELISSMRHISNEPVCFVPAMITSAHAKPAMVVEVLRAGAHQVLVLPTSASTLYRRLDWLLNDDLPFERRGDQYMVAGLEERLALSRPRPAYEPAPARRPLAVGETKRAPGALPYALRAWAAQN